MLGERRLRRRGPQPILADREVLTMKVVGEFLGDDQDQAIFQYVRRYYAHFFPAITRVHRTTFVRQAANLWTLKEYLWHHLVAQEQADPVCRVDSVPIPVCAFARALVPPLRRYRHLWTRPCHPPDLLRFSPPCPRRSLRTDRGDLAGGGRLLRPGGLAGDRAPRERTLLADRNYWSPVMTAELARYDLMLTAPFRHKTSDPDPQRSAVLGKRRWRIESTFAQLVERYQLKQVWARDLWHFGNRLVRKVLSHTIAMQLNAALGHPPLRLALLLD